MAREETVTQELVNAAANGLAALGQNVTNRAVLDAVGAGSMGTVAKLLRNWRATQLHSSGSVDCALDPDVSRAISGMITRRLAESGVELNAKVAELQSDLSSVIDENEKQAATI